MWLKIIALVAFFLGFFFIFFDAEAHSVDHPVRNLKKWVIQNNAASTGGWSVWGSSSANFASDAIFLLAKSKNIPYYNGAKGGEWGNHTLARIGARPFTIRVPGGVIPATAGKSIEVNVTNSEPHAYMKPFIGYLNGVRGILSSSDNGFKYTRLTPGAEVYSEAEYQFIPFVKSADRDRLLILWLGKNDINAEHPQISNTTAIVQLAVTAQKWARSLHKEAVILGHFSNTDLYKRDRSNMQNKIEYINGEYKRIFGDLYIDVPGYLYSSQVWADTGIVPTRDDLLNQKHRCLPLSLARDKGGHLSELTNRSVARFIESRLKENALF